MEDVSPLVSLDDAKRHLKEAAGIDAPTDFDIQTKLDQATSFVVRQCGALADATWDESTVPAPVSTAILLHLTELYTDRGDLERTKGFGEDASRYLIASGYRDPVLA